MFNSVFEWLPVAALIDSKIFCCHGGIAKTLESLDEIRVLKRPVRNIPSSHWLTDLLWSDPAEGYPAPAPPIPTVTAATGLERSKSKRVTEHRIKMPAGEEQPTQESSPKLPSNWIFPNGWVPNDSRGTSYMFGPAELDHFLEKHDLTMVVRAHQAVEDGYNFWHQKKLVTVFSAPNYTGPHTNKAAVLLVQEKLVAKFLVCIHVNMFPCACSYHYGQSLHDFIHGTLEPLMIAIKIDC